MSGHNTGAGLAVRRGASNTNDRGSSETRRRRRVWLVNTYRADVDVLVQPAAPGIHLATVVADEDLDLWNGALDLTRLTACRCYRCGVLLTVHTVTVDRIIPGCRGGRYVRNNIRPACGSCNSETGGALARRTTTRKARP